MNTSSVKKRRVIGTCFPPPVPVPRRLRDAAARDGEVGGQAILAAQANRRVVDVGHIGAGRRKRIEGVAVEVADRRTRAEGQIGFTAINGNLAPLRDRMARVAVDRLGACRRSQAEDGAERDRAHHCG